MMPQPPFLLQIVDAHGTLLRARTGGKYEADLIEHFVTHIMPRGVGVFRTAAHVEQDIRDGIAAALHALKVKNPFDVEAV